MFGPQGFGGIRGDSGMVTAAGGATVGIVSSWNIRRSGSYPDGKPRLRFQCQFSWVQPTLMAMCGRGEMKGRVRVQMKTKVGNENVDVVNWDEWRFENGVLALENILHFDTQPIK